MNLQPKLGDLGGARVYEHPGRLCHKLPLKRKQNLQRSAHSIAHTAAALHPRIEDLIAFSY